MRQSEQMGQCRKEVDDRYGSPCELVIADAIDRLAADVTAIKEAVCDGSVAAAIRERDEARAEAEKLKELRDVANRLYGAEQAKVERLRKELEQRQPAGNSPKTSDSSPAAPQPAAPPPGWLTEEERRVLRELLDVRWGDAFERVPAALRSILSRAGSPPVVEVPVMVFGSEMHKRYRAALDKAGIPWKEVGRE